MAISIVIGDELGALEHWNCGVAERVRAGEVRKRVVSGMGVFMMGEWVIERLLPGLSPMLYYISTDLNVPVNIGAQAYSLHSILCEPALALLLVSEYPIL